MGEGIGGEAIVGPTRRDPIHGNWDLGLWLPNSRLRFRANAPIASEAVGTPLETLPGSWVACLRREFFKERCGYLQVPVSPLQRCILCDFPGTRTVP